MNREQVLTIINETQPGRRTNLSGVDLKRADLSEANLRGADLIRADLRNANLRGADLSGAMMEGAKLESAILYYADLSGAKGLLNPIEFVNTHFEHTGRGIVVYKAFEVKFPIPPFWDVEPGAVLCETANPDRTCLCGSGINVATLNWVQSHVRPHKAIWECLIEWPWLAGVVVPYGTDGKIRASRVRLLRELPRRGES